MKRNAAAVLIYSMYSMCLITIDKNFLYFFRKEQGAYVAVYKCNMQKIG